MRPRCRVTTTRKKLSRCLSGRHLPNGSCSPRSAAVWDSVPTHNLLDGAGTRTVTVTALNLEIHYIPIHRAWIHHLPRLHWALRAHHHRDERQQEHLAARHDRLDALHGHRAGRHGHTAHRHGLLVVQRAVRGICSTRWPAEDGASKLLRRVTCWRRRTHPGLTHQDLQRQSRHLARRPRRQWSRR
jgi:hypothetical protein